MVQAVLRITVPSKLRNEVIRTLRTFLGPLRAYSGLVNCWLYRDMEEENTLALITEWQSQEALNRHLASREYLKVLELLERAREEPCLQFHTIGQTQGLELVESIRTEKTLN